MSTYNDDEFEVTWLRKLVLSLQVQNLILEQDLATEKGNRKDEVEFLKAQLRAEQLVNQTLRSNSNAIEFEAKAANYQSQIGVYHQYFEGYQQRELNYVQQLDQYKANAVESAKQVVELKEKVAKLESSEQQAILKMKGLEFNNFTLSEDVERIRKLLKQVRASETENKKKMRGLIKKVASQTEEIAKYKKQLFQISSMDVEAFVKSEEFSNVINQLMGTEAGNPSEILPGTPLEQGGPTKQQDGLEQQMEISGNAQLPDGNAAQPIATNWQPGSSWMTPAPTPEVESIPNP
ncbi:Laminin subunit alpha-5 [Orchesella cincta]|uniref:Laminin subunit alpha-5 n=1 Tax=Orchesella cincta TaxID=48709 RepID=A0A1D2MJ45_ORCCI|nr:Laminin subunit alpha-5 [Orchesella cincta]